MSDDAIVWDVSWVLGAAGGIQRESLASVDAVSQRTRVAALVRPWRPTLRYRRSAPTADDLVQAFAGVSGPASVAARIAYRLGLARHRVSPQGLVDHSAWAHFLATLAPEVATPLGRLVEPRMWNPSHPDVISSLRSSGDVEMLSTGSSGVGQACVFADVVAPTVPKDARAMVRFHDAIPELFPEYVVPDHVRVHRSAAGFHGSHGHLVPVSVAAVDQFTEAFGFRPDVRAIIPNVVALPEAWVDPSPDVLAPLLLPHLEHPAQKDLLESRRESWLSERIGNPFALAVAPFEPKKDLETLLRAHIEMQSRGSTAALVLVSTGGWMADRARGLVAEASHSGRLVIFSGVPQEVLWQLISRADVLVSTSLVEGFGRPPVEGLAAGARVVVTDIPAHREHLGGAVRYFPRGDASNLAAALESLLAQPNTDSERHDRRRSAIPIVAKYSPARVAEQWIDLVRTLG